MSIQREKLTVTIKKSLFKKIDGIVDGKKIRNRSHAAEFLIESGLGINKIKKAIILVGGEGIRLRPFTYELPKAMLPVQGKPMVQHVLEILKSHGVMEIIMAIGYKGEKIKEYFSDGRSFGLDIKYVVEKTPLGTAGPLRLAKKYLTESFFIVWGDILSSLDLTDFMHFHKEHNGLATVALTTVSDPSRYGVAMLNGNQIIGFVEKPKKGSAPSNLINSGMAIMEPEIIEKYVKKSGKSMVEYDIYPKLAAEGKLFGYPFQGQWFDTGTHESYEKAIKEWKNADLLR
ncbi:MAG: mannose-1-phosphate guanylyltransferase [Candidatus Berkelbacteria bacterium Athens1014_28]|uniref:Mannose-1-phosphate guanylyltransferase n=1 Tax=Candidatus Berkelbacteria bacterium Athens1014_28 TaxID=2017145 RepID=A0A554LP78_9BACT|nr:MAG: mannose-1-phosphate guanylyltransferase [Candidatus Berkelbacteria bacterium Athens1014_28]